MCFYVLSSVLLCPLRFPPEDYVRFVFASVCLWEGACLIYVICVCWRIVVSSTCCVVFLLCFSLSSVRYFAGFSGLSFCIGPSVFSNVYLIL